MDNKMTLEQFGAKIRYKHPEYSKYSNIEIAQKTLAKYPQYSYVISDLETPKEKTFARKVGDFFTSSTQKFGTTAGQVFASNKVTNQLSQAEQQASDIQLGLQKRLNETGSPRVAQALSDISGRQNITQQVTNVVPATQLSNKQVIGQALGTVLEATSGGVASGTKGIGLKSIQPTAEALATSKAQFLAKPLSGRIAQIGKETAKDLAITVPFGYTFDIAQKLQEDKSGASVFTPGAGTLISAVVPLGIGGIRAGRQATADLLGNVVAPNLSGVEAGAYQRLKTGQPQKYLKTATRENVLDEARASASAFKSAMYKQFGKGKEDIITEFTGKRIGIPEKDTVKLKQIAQRFGFEDRLPDNMQQMSAKETMDLLAEINNIPTVKELDDPLVKNLKISLSGLKDDIMSRAVDNFGGYGGSFDSLYKDYATKKNALKDIQSVIGKVGIKPGSIKLTPVQRATAENRLQKVFREDATGYLDAIRVLEDETNSVLLDKIAASQLAQKLPKSMRIATSNSPANQLGIVSDIISTVTLPLSSPRYGAWLISKIGGYDAGVVSKLISANPKIREAIYDAVTKDNMKFNDAVELYANDVFQSAKKNLKNPEASQAGFVKNPLAGASDNAGKAVSTTSDDLIQEAKKYKSAEEFVKAQTGGKFGNIKKIDINNPKEQAYISDFADNFMTQKSQASGLTYFTLDKMGFLNTALKQKGFKGVSASADFKGIYSLDKVIDNPALFEKYPDLRKVNVIFADFHTPTQRGVHIGNDIFLNSKLYAKDTTNIESTLVHEIEHSIQDLEKKLPKFSQFEQGRSMSASEYATDLREEGARKKQQEYLDIVKTKSQLEEIWNKANKK